MGKWPAATLAASLFLHALPAQAQLPFVDIQPEARLLSGGSLRIHVDVGCDMFGDTGENNVTVTQDDQSIFAQRSIGVLLCDGQTHSYPVVATPFDGAFHEGFANVSAFVSQIDSSTSEARQAQDFQVVRVVIPEPAAWMMMIIGFAVLGAAMRRRNRANPV